MVDIEEKRNEKLRAIGAFLLLFFIIALQFSLTHTLLDTHGKSMKPVLDEQTVSLCDKLYGQLKEEDIIAYRNPEKSSMIITHRIEEINGSKITTKGDNNARVDRFDLNRSDVICKITVKNVNKSGVL